MRLIFITPRMCACTTERALVALHTHAQQQQQQQQHTGNSATDNDL